MSKDNKKTTAHVIPHSHWDREWYMPLEYHRARLVALLDDVLELLQDDEYASYHLDGQTIALEDYLEIRPQNREVMARLIREGRLKVGPWYVDTLVFFRCKQQCNGQHKSH